MSELQTQQAIAATSAIAAATATAETSATAAVLATAAAGETPAEAAKQLQFHLAFQRLEAELRAVPVHQLLPINIDIPGAIATVLGAAPAILGLRGVLERLPEFELSRVDKLQDYALALGHAYAVHRSATRADEVSALAQEARHTRDRLHADANALVKRGLLDAARVRKLRGGNAHRKLAFDVLGLAEMLLERLDTFASKTAVRVGELERARLVANRLVAAVALRKHARKTAQASALLRRQAYTLLVRAYDEVRRAVRFVRWHLGDAQRIAPSLYAGRGGRARAAA